MKLKALINVRVIDNRSATEAAGYEYEVRIFNIERTQPIFVKQCSLSEIPVNDITSFTLNLPIKILNFRVINLPSLDNKRLREIIPYEIEASILTKKEDLVFDFLSEPSDKGGLETLVVYIDRHVLQNIIAPLQGLGINPSVITSTGIRRTLSEGIKGCANRLLAYEDISQEEALMLEAQELSSPTIRLSDKEIAVLGLKEEIIRPIFKTGLLSVALLTLLIGWLVFDAVTTTRESAAMKRELRSRYTGLFPEDRRISDENYQLKSKIRALQDKGESLISISAVEILARLSSAKIEGVIINELSVERENLKVQGEVPSVEAIEAYKKRLAWINNPVVSNVTQGERGLYSFMLSGKINDGLWR